MRLHRLDVTAFGPYRDHQAVDFDELGSDGLFLLHGDTGAGKTTVLDAVAFALYGSVPGVRADVIKRLRCDTADSGVATTVALELTVQGHRMRINRSPEYQRPKKHGDGYTKQNAKASLTWLGNAPGELPAEGSTRIDEVNRTVERLLGMNRDQFVQVVMLPQGQFARFLQAETKERADLLEKLFGTQHFAAVEKWFLERRKQRRNEVQEQEQHARELLARVSQEAGSEPEEADNEQTWLDGLEKRLIKEHEDANAVQASRRRGREEAERELAIRRERADKVDRVRRAKAELTELEAHQSRHTAWRAEKDAAERAVPVSVVHQAVRDVDAELRNAAEEVGAAEANCPEPDRAKPLDELRAMASARHEKAGALAQLLPEVRQQETDRNQITQLKTRLDKDEREEEALVQRQAELPEQITAARALLDDAKEAQARLEPAEAKVEESTAVLAVARELPKAEKVSAEASTLAQRAVDEHQQARDRLQDLRSRRLAGMAAELAGELRAGMPCSVCGSPEHPAPATPVDDAVRAEDEEQAQREEQVAYARREKATEAKRQAEHECARLREQLGDRGKEELEFELERWTKQRDELRQQAAHLPEYTNRVAELDNTGARLTEQLGELRSRIAATRTELAALQNTVDEREERLRGARGDYPGIDEHRAALLDDAARIDRLVTARTARDEVARRAERQRVALGDAAVEAGFADIDTALAAQRDQQRRAELAEALAEVEERGAVVRATLAELADVDADAEVGLEEAAEAATAAQQAAELAAAQERSAEQRRSAVAQLAERLRDVWAQLEPAQAEFAELDALADVVNGQGQNSRKMSLRSYVLAARLEEVAVAASRRLQRMSEGRYSFVHSDAAGSHGARGGLGLEVLDDYSGKVRPAKTLSGGESFLASLSLALGLADVVAAETGGALLDTLFIDEGFGTLDGNTLDLVMDTLDELRADGRVIGLVSHVEEMRQRIGVRLRVRKSRSGSTLELES